MDSLNVFFWIDTIKAKKSAEYEAAIANQDILEDLKAIIQLKQRIIDEALREIDLEEQKVITEVLRQVEIGQQEIIDEVLQQLETGQQDVIAEVLQQIEIEQQEMVYELLQLQQIEIGRQDNFRSLIKKYNLGLDLIEKVKDILKEVKTSDNLPDIKFKMTQSGKIDPKGKGAYTFEKLPAGDLKGLFLGYESNSCQSVGKDGEICAINGFTRTDAGFYVLHNQTGKIKGQFYAWLAEDGLVLDSYESRPEDKKLLIPILTAMKTQLGNTNLYLGTGGGISKLSFEILGRPKATSDLKHYGDSNNVYKIEGEIKLLENQNSNLDLNLDKVIQIVDLLNQCHVMIPLTLKLIELIVKFPILLKYENLIEEFSKLGTNKIDFVMQKLINYLEQIPDLVNHPKLIKKFVDFTDNKEVTKNLMSLTNALLESHQEELYKIIELGNFYSLIHNSKLVDFIIQLPALANHPKLVEVFVNYGYYEAVTENLMKLTKGLLASHQEKLNNFASSEGCWLILCNSQLVELIVKFPLLLEHHQLTECFARFGANKPIQVAMDQIKEYSEEGLEEFIQSHVGEAEVLYSKLCDEYRDVSLAGELQF